MIYRNFIRMVGCLLLMAVVVTAFHSSRKRIEATVDDAFKQAIEQDYQNRKSYLTRNVWTNRLSNDVNIPKYINTTQTEIYEKGNLVFNYHRARNFARKNNRLILVEGAPHIGPYFYEKEMYMKKIKDCLFAEKE